MRAIIMSCNNCNKDYAFDTIKTIIRPNMKVACIPFASDLQWQLRGDYTDYINQHYSTFASFGISKNNFKVVKPTLCINDMKKIIKESDIIYFSGGFMENIMFILEALDIKDFVCSFKEEKIFMGESAGALVMEDIYTSIPNIEDNYKKYRKEKGLGIIKDFDIIVHFDKNNKKHWKNKKVLELMDKHEKDIICLTDEALVIIEDDKIYPLGDYIM